MPHYTYSLSSIAGHSVMLMSYIHQPVMCCRCLCHAHVIHVYTSVCHVLQVLVFLDSHIEVNIGWLEPLVSRVVQSPSTVVQPIIDIIDADTFQYRSSPLVRGGFTWSMRFSWEEIPTDVVAENPLYIK